MNQTPRAPEPVLELAKACEDYVQRVLGFQLDYSLETLSVLDQYAREVRETVLERPELMELTARALGAYFGEVVCRAVGAFWRLPSQNIVDWQVCVSSAFVWFNPIGVAYDALAGHAEHGGPGSQIRVAPHERELVRARLGQLADVDEEEYYLLSTRMEVLELVVEELQRHMQEQGYEDSSFDEADYEAEQKLPPV